MTSTRCSAITLLLAACLASGCATQLHQPSVAEEELDDERAAQLALALSRFLERQVRLDQVGKKLAVHGAELCGEDVDHAFGITWASRTALSEPYQLVASRVGLTGGVQIWGTTPELAADRAGIEPGTSVIAVNGKPVDDFDTLSEAIHPSWESGRLRLELRGDGDEPIRDITLRGTKACRYTYVVVESDAVNAFADGDRVLVAEGMMRFADRDEELALVVGHEMAHNALGHVREKKVTRGIGRGIGSVFDVAIGLVIPTGGAFGRLGEKASDAATSGRSRDFESDADYMGLYMARRAGYDISEAHLFWREMAAEYPESIEGSMTASHPSTPRRSKALTAAVAEIHTKEQAKQPLVPEREPGSEPANSE